MRVASFARACLRAALPLAMLAVVPVLAAPAAVLDGVTLSDSEQAGGVTLRLNGIGLRTYSVFGIHIYVAGLYLEQPSHDGEAVLASDSTKLLVIRFVHDVDTDNARKAWIEGFDGNCTAPCRLPEAEVKRFLDAVPAFRRGDSSALMFTHGTVQITLNGRLMGSVTDPVFARTILATFIGRSPPTDRLKRELLNLQ
jgi:long-chain acyl-CoA synthetase